VDLGCSTLLAEQPHLRAVEVLGVRVDVDRRRQMSEPFPS